MSEKLKVLFLCTGNSCRSQMAEGWARALKRDVIEAYSAGVVTVCDHAHETCPLFPGRTKVVHVGFDDPPRLAEHAKTEDEALRHYRRVRDEIKAFVERLPDALLPDCAAVLK